MFERVVQAGLKVGRSSLLSSCKEALHTFQVRTTRTPESAFDFSHIVVNWLEQSSAPPHLSASATLQPQPTAPRIYVTSSPACDFHDQALELHVIQTLPHNKPSLTLPMFSLNDLFDSDNSDFSLLTFFASIFGGFLEDYGSDIIDAYQSEPPKAPPPAV